MAKVLVIEDDLLLAQSLYDWLQLEGHRPEMTHDGEDGLNLLKVSGFDVAIIDWDLPGMTGTEICSNYRNAGGKTPILMLTKKSTIADKEQGFEAGADDYLSKPFDLRELRARVKALLRRSTNLFDTGRKVGSISLDNAGCTVTIGTRIVKLLPREFALIEFLMRHPHTFFTAEKLLDHVWHSEADSSIQALRTCISRIRTKTDEEGQSSLIETSKGWGYKISENYTSDLAIETKTSKPE